MDFFYLKKLFLKKGLKIWLAAFLLLVVFFTANYFYFDYVSDNVRNEYKQDILRFARLTVDGVDLDAEYLNRVILYQQSVFFVLSFLLSFIVLFIFIYLSYRRQTILELAAERKKMDFFIKNIPGAVYRCCYNKDWTMEFISEKIAGLSGFPATDFINNSVRTYASIIHPKDRAMVEEKIGIMVEKNSSYNIEYRIVTADKKTLWVKEWGRGIMDKAGRVRFLEGIIIDNSKEKENEIQLAKRNEELERMNSLMVGRELKMVELKNKISPAYRTGRPARPPAGSNVRR